MMKLKKISIKKIAKKKTSSPPDYPAKFTTWVIRLK